MVPISDASFSHLRLRMWGAQAFHCPVCHALPAAASPAVARPSPNFPRVAFVDPSGGSADSMTLAIAHKKGNTSILDIVWFY